MEWLRVVIINEDEPLLDSLAKEMGWEDSIDLISSIEEGGTTLTHRHFMYADSLLEDGAQAPNDPDKEYTVRMQEGTVLSTMGSEQGQHWYTHTMSVVVFDGNHWVQADPDIFC